MRSLGAFKPFAVLAVSALLLFSQATPAAAAQVFNVSEPATTVFPTLFNPCNSEVITVTQGVAHLHLEITASSNGGFHIDINGNLEGVKGTGSLGNSYTVTAWFHESTNSSSSSAFVFSDGDVFHLLSTGSAPNADAAGVLHLTINANGDVTASVDNMHFKCVG